MINYLFSIIFIIIMYIMIGEVFKQQHRDNGWINSSIQMTVSEGWAVVVVTASIPVLRWFVLLLLIAAAFKTPDEIREIFNIAKETDDENTD